MSIESYYRPPKEGAWEKLWEQRVSGRKSAVQAQKEREARGQKGLQTLADGNPRAQRAAYLMNAGKAQANEQAAEPAATLELSDEQKALRDKAIAAMREKLKEISGKIKSGEISSELRLSDERVEAHRKWYEAGQTYTSSSGQAVKLTIMEANSEYNEAGYAHFSSEMKQAQARDMFNNGFAGATWYNASTKQEHVIPSGGGHHFNRNNIPSENCVDEAVEQYKARYTSLDSKTYESDEQERLTKSLLDQDFSAYLHSGFKKAGLSEDEANKATKIFTNEFRIGVVSGKSIEQSKLDGLRKLNEISPELNERAKYTSSFSFAI